MIKLKRASKFCFGPSSIWSAHPALRPGGLWVSIGPLDYVGTDGGHMGGFRLTGDELLLLIQRRGFEMLEVKDVKCAYTQSRSSMLQQHFEAMLFGKTEHSLCGGGDGKMVACELHQ